MYLVKPLTRVGIVGNGSDKFTPSQASAAKAVIRDLLRTYTPCILVSGRSPKGGIDQWSEEIALEAGILTDIKPPKCDSCGAPFEYRGMPFCPGGNQHRFSWPGKYGFKKRNIDIARTSDVVFILLSDTYPDTFRGWKSDHCKHCPEDAHHIQSGACWTGNKAASFGKPARWIIISGKEPIR